MAIYSTPPGICAEGNHKIEDCPKVGNKGFLSTKPYARREIDGTRHSQGIKVSLCRKHYLEAFQETYPGQELPKI